MSGIHKKWIYRCVWGEIKHVPIPQKVDFQHCWGGNETHWIPKKGKLSLARVFWWEWGMSGFRKKWISKSVWMEMGQVRIPETLNWASNCWGGNGPSSGLRTSEFPNQIGRTWCKSGFQKKLNWESSKSDFFSKSVWGEMWHVRISENIQFRICLGEHGACPDHTKKKLLTLTGEEMAVSGFQKRRISKYDLMEIGDFGKSQFPNLFGGKWGVSGS